MGKMNKNLISLKPYLESVKEQCSCLSNEGLTEIILGLAKEIPAKQRAGFLRTIDRLSQEQPPAAWDEEILSQIEALEFISPKEKNQKPLLVEMLLMAGRIDTAFEKAGEIRALGWSYGERAGAVLFGGILSFLCLDRIEEAVTIKRVLKHHADSDHESYTFFESSEDERDAGPGICISEEILRGLRSAAVSAEEETKYLLWAVRIGRSRSVLSSSSLLR